MTAGLSKLATAVTLIFIISLVTLIAELIYVLWRRRRRTQCLSRTYTDSSSAFDSSSSSSPSSSKHLLYFFCLNNRYFSRVRPKSVPLTNLNLTASAAPVDEMEVIDVFKLQNMYGPSRILFTIKEDDKEKEVDLESDKPNSVCSSADSFNLKLDDRETLPELKMDAGHYPDGVEYNAVGEIEMTPPFSTPYHCDCESPLYFTPTSSPGQIERSR